MIKMIKKHLANDIREIRAAWNNMDTLSHLLVIYFITVMLMTTDMIGARIHW